jgi:signal transduction histidine kinase
MSTSVRAPRRPWGRALSVSLGGIVATILLDELLADNPLISSVPAQTQFLLVGAGCSVVAGFLWLRGPASAPASEEPRPARRRLRGLYWRLTSSYFLATLVTILIAERASRREWPFEFVRDTYINHLFTQLFDNSTNSGILAAFFACFAGFLTGWLVSGGLTRRLRRIAQAAHVWSRGEFAVRVRDPAHDEVGQLARDLNGMAEQLQSLLAARQELAVVDERNRLARELHDSVKQQVFANALLVRAARRLVVRDPEKAQAYLADAEELASQTQEELVALIRALRPAAVADKGLAEAIRDYAEEWSGRMGIVTRVRAQGERATPLDIEDALLRVTQEALANVARHSQACAVEIRLLWEGEYLSLGIADDGDGFDATRARGKGIGLASMRERIEALGGTLRITSSDAMGTSGTTIEARVPVPLTTTSASPLATVAGPRSEVVGREEREEARDDGAK